MMRFSYDIDYATQDYIFAAFKVKTFNCIKRRLYIICTTFYSGKREAMI